MLNGSNRMKRSFSAWRKALLARFGDREDIGIDKVYARYFMEDNLPKDEVFECLKVIEFEYELPAGLIRPGDRLKELFRPVPTKNPLLWLFYRSREEDSESEINYELGKRMRKHGTFDSWQKIETFGDFIRAWCGQRPTKAEGEQE